MTTDDDERGELKKKEKENVNKNKQTNERENGAECLWI